MMNVTSTAILINTATGRYHPILFRDSPSAVHTSRQKSIGHHTTGFDTRKAAEAHCAEKGFPAPDALVEWDGVSVPALTI